MKPTRRPAFLTIDVEDYRSICLRDCGVPSPVMHPAELEREVDVLLELFDDIAAVATFFCVGRLATDLAPSVWERIAGRHPIGAHSFDHQRVRQQGPRRFALDVRRTREALEDVSGQPVLSYRAPYFSNTGCDPWFGEELARAGILIDSSQRLLRAPRGFRGTMPLEGSGGEVTEIPLASVGFGGTRVSIIGGTYFRLLPLTMIRRLMELAEAQGFVPMVYLHPYDLDPEAAWLDPAGVPRAWALRRGDVLRRAGRSTAAAKLRALAEIYKFGALESILQPTPS
jgi:hypothetical protein